MIFDSTGSPFAGAHYERIGYIPANNNFDFGALVLPAKQTSNEAASTSCRDCLLVIDPVVVAKPQTDVEIWERVHSIPASGDFAIDYEMYKRETKNVGYFEREVGAVACSLFSKAQKGWRGRYSLSETLAIVPLPQVLRDLVIVRIVLVMSKECLHVSDIAQKLGYASESKDKRGGLAEFLSKVKVLKNHRADPSTFEPLHELDIQWIKKHRLE